MAFDPEEDAQFQDLVRKLAPARRRKRLAEEVEATFDARSPFAPDPDLFREDSEDEFEDSFYIRDFLKPGPGFVEDGLPAFWLPFLDLGNGEVDLRVRQASGVATFTRATTATTINSAGRVVSVAAGVPRSYYNPTSLSYLGYLAEGARTNLLLRSEAFDNASWSKTDTTITADNITAPDGATTADLLTEGVAGTSAVAQAYTGTSNTAQAFTVWVKRGNHDWVYVAVYEAAAFANHIQCFFNLATGAVGTASNAGTASGAAGSITAYPNGWYRIELRGTVGNAATALALQTNSATADSNSTRVSNGTRYQWGAQVEDNVSFASSYIPTAGSTVTRNADVLTYPTAGWLNTNAGTLAVTSRHLGTPASGQQWVASLYLSTDVSNNRMHIRRDAPTTVSFNALAGGAGQAALSLGTLANDTIGNAAFAYASNDFAAVLNAGTVQTDTSGTVPSVDTLAVGHETSTVTQTYGAISGVRYWARRRPNAELQTLTA